MRKFSIVCALALTAVSLAACGSSDKPDKGEEFAKAYKPLNQQLLDLGDKLGTTIQGAKGTSNAELATQFGDLGSELAKIGKDINALDPPDDEQADVDELTRIIDEGAETLNKISDAAKSGDADAARTNTVTLLRQSAELNSAQNKVALDTGAPKGDR